jgi:hypothetical protein
MLDVATYVKAIEGKDFGTADARRVVSTELIRQLTTVRRYPDQPQV